MWIGNKDTFRHPLPVYQPGPMEGDSKWKKE